MLHVKPNALTVRWCDSTDATGFYYQDITYKIPCNKISNSNPIYTLIGPDKSKPIEWTATRAFSVTQGMGNVYFCIKNSEGIARWFDAYAVQSVTGQKQNMQGDFLLLSGDG